MDRQEILTTDELIEIVDSDSDNNFRATADRLLEAFTDWPTENLEYPTDMLLELRSEINRPLTYKNLADYLTKLHPASDAWKMESISGLLQIFELNNEQESSEIELTDILKQLTKHYRT